MDISVNFTPCLFERNFLYVMYLALSCVHALFIFITEFCLQFLAKFQRTIVQDL